MCVVAVLENSGRNFTVGAQGGACMGAEPAQGRSLQGEGHAAQWADITQTTLFLTSWGDNDDSDSCDQVGLPYRAPRVLF